MLLSMLLLTFGAASAFAALSLCMPWVVTNYNGASGTATARRWNRYVTMTRTCRNVWIYDHDGQYVIGSLDWRLCGLDTLYRLGKPTGFDGER